MNAKMTKMLLVGMGVLAMLPAAKGDEWTQKTTFTFSGPVEIPGQTLPAGTYVFKLANSQSNRHIVQVFNQNENHVFGTFLAIPDYRMRPAEKPIIRFEERAAGSPPAIKAWFYPGRNYGHEFVYPKKEAVALAAANNTPVPSVPTELTPQMTKPEVVMSGPEVAVIIAAPLKAEEPNGEEVELAQAFAPSPGLPDRLPATGTQLPALGLAGIVALVAAFVLRIRAARTN
jgi:LPXTG-motif cell wall-anchored protein